MKKLLSIAFLLSTVFAFSQDNQLWEKQSPVSLDQVKKSRKQLPTNEVYSLNIESLKEQLSFAPKRGDVLSQTKVVISFPNADGTFERFRIMEAAVMDPALEAKYPGIKSYAGQGVDNTSDRIRFSVSPLGLQSMRLSSDKAASFIEPYSEDLTQYTVYKRADKGETYDAFECEVVTEANKVLSGNGAASKNADDGLLRTYRIAISTTGEYTDYHGGTKALALAAMNTTMTRVNAVFENDFNVTMVLIANTDDVIYLDSATDPYTNGGYNSQLQSTLTSVIGEANYDVGHLFAAAGNNGNAGCIGCVCVNGSKGSGWTSRQDPEGDPFDIDYVAHEIGHQFGGNHTWTHGGNEGRNVQMEPGSGSTIMGYAGITGATTDVQSNSDAYFHAISVQQITNYVKSTSCQTNTNTGNAVPTANAGANYTIPSGTAFVLTGAGSDTDTQDVLTYCWEQMDENDSATQIPSTTATGGPVFRSYLPTTDNKRYFPRLETVKTGATSWYWEAVPDVDRTLNFRLTVRDNRVGGANNNSDDMSVVVNEAAGPFIVNSPNTSVIWSAGSPQAITWNVAGTTGNGINAANVDIFLSTDGGDTYPIALATGVANNGAQTITVPNMLGTQNRVMVKGANNIFFDISNADFTIGEAVDCVANVPEDLSASNIQSSSATLSWTAVPAAAYDLRYREVGTTTWITSDELGVSSNVTGLIAQTQYEAQVRSKCTDGSTSVYSSLINFTTTDVQLEYCDSMSTNTNDEYISNVTLNTINNTTGPSFYTDYSATISTDLTEGETYDVIVTPTWTGTIYSEGYAAWIDYNNDGDFEDAGELIWSKAPSTDTPNTGTFTVPTGTALTSVRLRVSLKYNAIPTPCETFTYGEVEDYTVSLVSDAGDTEAPTVPLNLVASNETTSTVDLSWDASSDNVGVTGYEIFMDGVSIGTVTGTTSTVTDLFESTTYVFTVTAFDAAGNASSMSNEANATTTNGGGLIAGYYFETGFEGWSDPGADCLRVNWGERSYEGQRSIRLRNGTATSLSESPLLDFTGNNTISVEFHTYSSGMETGETFYLELLSNGVYEIIGTYVSGVDFLNGEFFTDTVFVSSVDYNFSNDNRIRFRNAANANNDHIYFDQVIINGDGMFVPTPPLMLSAHNVGPTSVDLNWLASIDLNANGENGVVTYDVYQDNVLIGTTSQLDYTVTNLVVDTTYSFYIVAQDEDNNMSFASNTVTVTTQDLGPILIAGYYFETGFEGWSDPGANCVRVNWGARSYEGQRSIRLRNGTATSLSESPELDLTGISNISIEFHTYANSMESGETFYLELLSNGVYEIIGTYVSGTDFNNGEFFTDTVLVNSIDYDFSTDNRIRFRNAGNANNDQIYFDQVIILGDNAPARPAGPTVIDTEENVAVFTANALGKISLHPNPAASVLNIDIVDDSFDGLEIYSTSGHLVRSISTLSNRMTLDISSLASGMYFVRFSSNGFVVTKRFVKK